ncbi:MAG: glycosyltransferase, partial [Candidatus Hodarchaeota archaeon]
VNTYEKQKYILENNFSFILTSYYNPAVYHFEHILKEKLILFPWAIPDTFLYNGHIKTPTQDFLMIFGQFRSIIYETRNWCKKFNFVKTFHHSGEAKTLRGLEYFKWLRNFNAIIAATSLRPEYRHTIAKYFEIPASASLLFAQESDDLALLGFEDNKNCIIFNKKNFKQKAYDYLKNKENYVKIIENGRKLVLEKHTLSKRIQILKEHIKKNL